MLILEKSCNIIKFIEDIELAKSYKDIFIYNNLDSRVKIYHSKIGSINCQKNSLDYFSLDHLCYKNVGLIHLKSSDFDDIIKGANQTIISNKPILFIENVDSIEIKNVFLEELEYQRIVFDYYTIYIHSNDLE